MIAFIIKSGLCMILLFGLYWLLLRKEKLFKFNRYYLIFSILFSLTVPFVAIPVVTGYNFEKATNIAELLNPGQESPEDLAVLPQVGYVIPVTAEINSGGEPVIMEPQTNGSRRVFFLIYYSGMILMLLRFLRNLFIINRMFRRSEKIDNDWYRIALLDHPVNPFSFLRTVFLNKQDYLQNRISANVLMHEIEHVRQAHSRDIIFFEILQMILWFNPVLFLFKRAARINHEYLADEAVIRRVSDMKSYAGELINYISGRRNVTFTSGFSPSMIRLRLLMLNSNTSRCGKTIRMVATLFTSVLLLSFMSIRPEYPGSGSSDNSRRPPRNKDIVIEEVHFIGPDFNPLKSLVIFNGRELGADEMITLDPQQIKKIDILTNRKAVRRYGKKAKDGAVEISSYDFDKKSVPDTLNFKSVYTVNDTLPGKKISFPVSELYSFNSWTYPVFPNQDPSKRWRLHEIMTRDYYKIWGKVVRSDGEPLNGVKVSAAENTSEAITGSDGSFLIRDINPGARIEVTATGFEPLSFNVTSKVYKFDLSITLLGINEPDPDLILTNTGSELLDFSGRWRLNKELTHMGFPEGYERMYNIHQYDSDSILINTTTMGQESREFSSENVLVFNTVKANMSKDKTSKYVSSCTIAPDGLSFSVTNTSKSIIVTPGRSGSKQIENYSMSEDGKQLFIRRYNFPDSSSGAAREYAAMVFDRM